MTELPDTPVSQSRDPMDSHSGPDDSPPNPERRRTRRRRWYLLAAIPVIALVLVTLAVSRVFSGGNCIAVGIVPEPRSGVTFDLAPFLAHAARPVHVRACVPSSCSSMTVKRGPDPFSGPGFSSDWRPEGTRVVHVFDPSLTSAPVTVRVTMTDQGGTTIFDSSARVQPEYSFEDFEIPPCYPDAYEARVEAQSTGRLEPRRFH
jgi:hypothetical protein